MEDRRFDEIFAVFKAPLPFRLWVNHGLGCNNGSFFFEASAEYIIFDIPLTRPVGLGSLTFPAPNTPIEEPPGSGTC